MNFAMNTNSEHQHSTLEIASIQPGLETYQHADPTLTGDGKQVVPEGGKERVRDDGGLEIAAKHDRHELSDDRSHVTEHRF